MIFTSYNLYMEVILLSKCYFAALWYYNILIYISVREHFFSQNGMVQGHCAFWLMSLSFFFFCAHFYCRFNLLFWVNSNQVASRESDIHQVDVDLEWNESVVSRGSLTCSLLWIRPHFNFLPSYLPWILVSDWNWKSDLTFITVVCRLSGPCQI